MKTAITAASGHLGSAIISRLITVSGKDDLVGIARTPEKAKHMGIEIRKGDYNNPRELVTALKGVEKLLVVSGMAQPQIRIQQHRNVIESAKTNGVKKIVYTSIVGDQVKSAFSPVVKSNRQTEEDIQNSGMNWSIGRNGIYIEPDLEYVDNYISKGGIFNSAGNGLCAYTSRDELAVAYSELLTKEIHNGKIYNLVGTAISQTQLAEYINQAYNTDLIYKAVQTEDFVKDRKKEMGEFLGNIIGGIYDGIRNGSFNVRSDFKQAVGRPHKSVPEMIYEYKKNRE